MPVFRTTSFDSLNVNHDPLEYEYCQALFYPEEGHPRVADMLLPGAYLIILNVLAKLRTE